MSSLSERIEVHLPCATCDYDLFGVDTAGRCPECGSSKRLSLAPSRLYFVPTSSLKKFLLPLKIWVVCLLVFPLLAWLSSPFPSRTDTAFHLVWFLTVVCSSLVLALKLRRWTATSVGSILATIHIAFCLIAILIYCIAAIQIWLDPYATPAPLHYAALSMIPFDVSIIGLHIMIAALHKRIPSRSGVHIAWTAVLGLAVIMVLPFLPPMSDGIVIDPRRLTSWIWIPVLLGGTFISSLLGAILAWRNIKVVMRFQIQHGGSADVESCAW